MEKLSKQALAKKAQRFRKKPNCCGNCVFFDSEIVSKYEEKNKTCTYGSFAVGRSNVCDYHVLKVE